MQRPVWFRTLVAVWGLWFTAALSEAPGLHACPVHGGHGAHPGHAMDHGRLDHAGHMSHGAQSSGPTHGSHHAPASCTCFGLCCCAAPGAAPAPQIELASDVLVAVQSAQCTDVAGPLIHRAYSLPFANGPPAA